MFKKKKGNHYSLFCDRWIRVTITGDEMCNNLRAVITYIEAIMPKGRDIWEIVFKYMLMLQPPPPPPRLPRGNADVYGQRHGKTTTTKGKEGNDFFLMMEEGAFLTSTPDSKHKDRSSLDTSPPIHVKHRGYQYTRCNNSKHPNDHDTPNGQRLWIFDLNLAIRNRNGHAPGLRDSSSL